MALYPEFIGPTYQSQSPNADLEDCLNWYPELVESGAGKNRLVYYRTPGLALFTTLPQTPIRGIFAGENRLFAIAGTEYYEIFHDGTYTDYGSVGNDGNPADLEFNGSQVLIASNGWAWVSTGGAPSAAHFNNPWTDLVIDGTNNHIITSAANPFTAADVGAGIDITGGTGFTVGFYTVSSVNVGTGQATLNAAVGTTGSTGGQGAQRVPAVRIAFLDSYFWAQNSFSSKQFNLSNLLDGTTWDPLQFASKEGYPDNISAIWADHEEMYIFGDEQATEVWRANGQVQPNFPYQRDPSAFMHFGCRAPFSPARVYQGVAWLAGDQKRGGVFAAYAEGYQPRRISTHAVEQIWTGYSKTSDAVSYSELLNGHHFWVISFPTANATWCYDFTTRMWHRRGWWNGASTDRARVAYQCYVGLGSLAPAWYGGDWQNGKIYTVSTAHLDDAGVAPERIRVAPYIAREAYRDAHDSFQLDMQGSGTVPATLYFTDDNGATWSNPKYNAWNPTAAKRQGLLWRRLGSPRARAYKVRIQAAVDVALINAYINGRPGEA